MTRIDKRRVLRYVYKRPRMEIARGNLIRHFGREVLIAVDALCAEGVLTETVKVNSDGKNPNTYYSSTPEREQAQAAAEYAAKKAARLPKTRARDYNEARMKRFKSDNEVWADIREFIGNGKRKDRVLEWLSQAVLSAILNDYEKLFQYPPKIPEEKTQKPKRTTNVRELLWNSYPHVCGLCGNKIETIDEMHVDHIIPLSRGGKDILANLQLTHASCNLAKGSKTIEEEYEDLCFT